MSFTLSLLLHSINFVQYLITLFCFFFKCYPFLYTMHYFELFFLVSLVHDLKMYVFCYLYFTKLKHGAEAQFSYAKTSVSLQPQGSIYFPICLYPETVVLESAHCFFLFMYLLVILGKVSFFHVTSGIHKSICVLVFPGFSHFPVVRPFLIAA